MGRMRRVVVRAWGGANEKNKRTFGDGKCFVEFVHDSHELRLTAVQLAFKVLEKLSLVVELGRDGPSHHLEHRDRLLHFVQLRIEIARE